MSNASEIPSVCMDLQTLSKQPIVRNFSVPEGELGLLDSPVFDDSVIGVQESLLYFPAGLDTTTDPAKLVLLLMLH